MWSTAAKCQQHKDNIWGEPLFYSLGEPGFFVNYTTATAHINQMNVKPGNCNIWQLGITLVISFLYMWHMKQLQACNKTINSTIL